MRPQKGVINNAKYNWVAIIVTHIGHMHKAKSSLDNKKYKIGSHIWCHTPAPQFSIILIASNEVSLLVSSKTQISRYKVKF